MLQSGELLEDRRKLDEIIGQDLGFREKLEEIQTAVPDENTITSLLDIDQAVRSSQRIFRKYDVLKSSKKHKDDHYHSQKFLESYRTEVGLLDTLLYSAVGALVGSITKDFYHWLKHLDKKEEARERLNSSARLYSQLHNGLNLVSNTNYRGFSDRHVRRYGSFVDDISLLDMELEEIKSQYGESLSSENVAEINVKLKTLRKKYQNLTKKHRPTRVLRKHKHFDYHEKLQEIDDFNDQINKERELQENVLNKEKICDDVVYIAREGKYAYDVRNFIFPDDAVLLSLIEDKKLAGKTMDETAHRCMTWVQDNLKYISDKKRTGFSEEWQFPTEALENGSGDCEDGTNLMVSLIRNAGIPAYRIRNVCGIVEYKDPNTGNQAKEGHSWTEYLRETDNEWVNLDWCFLASKQQVSQRRSADKLPQYKEVMFSFNDKHSWADEPVEVGKGYFEKTYVMKEEVSQESEAKTSEFNAILDVATGKARHTGWDDKLSYIKRFIDRRKESDAYLQTDGDFSVVEETYQILSERWKTGKLGNPSSPCRRERLLVSETLNTLHSYIEDSRALYGAKLCVGQN